MQSTLAPRPDATIDTDPPAKIEDHATLLRDQPEYPSSQTHNPPPIQAPSYQPISDIMTTAPGQAAPASPSSTSPPQTSEHSDGDGNQTDGRKGYGKRELSTSKRAAQNRAAQRAFRQRKEGYIKKLEEQVRDYQVLSDNFKTVQAENYQLRDYIINLQSRLLESQHEVPPPPSSVDGLSPGKVHPQLHSQHPSIPAVNPQPSQPHQGQTLPRIAEMGNSRTTPPHDSVSGPKEIGQQYGYTEQASKRLKTSPTVTPSQSALQGNAVLNQSPTPR